LPEMRRVLFALPLAFALSVPAMADDPVVTIIMRDHQFVPSEVPLPAGVKVKLLIKNEQSVSGEFESSSLHREKIISDGSEETVYVGPLAPGTYDSFDDFHRETRGHLVVK